MNQVIPQPGIELDITRYPNPFFGVNNGTFIDSERETLKLVDGGEDGEVIPIQPLLVKAREVDVIIAIDGVSFHYNSKPQRRRLFIYVNCSPEMQLAGQMAVP